MSSEPQPTSRKLTSRVRAAVRYARASLQDLAEEAEYSEGSIDRYLNRARPGPAFARALADALARRGRKLLERAERIRREAEHLDRGGDR